MIPITYLIGDATEPIMPPGHKPRKDWRIIAHVCNDIGAWGKGFVLALSARDKRPEEAYRDWMRRSLMKEDYFRGNSDRLGYEIGGRAWKQHDPTTMLQLGEQQSIFGFDGDASVIVVNMIAQRGIKWVGNGPPLSYLYLWRCLVQLRDFAANTQSGRSSVHMPRIGCGLAGGQWPIVEALIEGTLCKADVPVFVYDLPVHNKLDSGCFAESRAAERKKAQDTYARCKEEIPKSGPAQCAAGHWLGSAEHPIK